jgi:uncharacterized protein YecE (DUF72 family)
MTLYVGTSGWAYKEWKPDFYPADLPQARFLEHYAQNLSACEVNATFYRIQSEKAFSKWAAAAPESFRYSTKAHRMITHGKGVGIEGRRAEFLKDFFDSVRPLGNRLGAVLFQYPPTKQRDDAGLDDLLAYLPKTHRYAFEFRHDSWADPQVEKRIAEAGATVCLSSQAGDVPSALPPGPLGYVRLRAERYTEKQRVGWMELLQREAETRDVFAFTKHEGIPTKDEFGGLGLARWLVARPNQAGPGTGIGS